MLLLRVNVLLAYNAHSDNLGAVDKVPRSTERYFKNTIEIEGGMNLSV